MKLDPRPGWSLSIALLALLLTVLVPALAAAQPGDGEFIVNTTSPTKQRESLVAFSPDGGFTVVWRDYRAGLTARFFPAGQRPSEDVVLVENLIFDHSPGTGIIFSRRAADLLYLPGGDFYLFWTEEKSFLSAAPFYENYTTLDQDVLGQRFSAEGRPLGNRFRVHRAQRGLQRNPAVALDGDGGFLVAWEVDDDVTGVGPNEGVYVRRFNDRGAAVGPEIKLDERVGVSARLPALAAGADGGFLAVWQGEGDGTDGNDVFARLLDADGAPVGPQFQLNGPLPRDQFGPAVAAGADGNYLAVWYGPIENPVYYRVFGQMVGADGALLGPELRISESEVERAHALPKVAAAPSGEYLVAWLLWYQDFQTAVVGVHLDAQANALDDSFWISEHQTSSRTVSAAAAPGGRGYLVSWEGFTDGDLGISARRVAAPGPEVMFSSPVLQSLF